MPWRIGSMAWRDIFLSFRLTVSGHGYRRFAGGVRGLGNYVHLALIIFGINVSLNIPATRAGSSRSGPVILARRNPKRPHDVQECPTPFWTVLIDDNCR